MNDNRYQQALDYLYSFVDFETQRRPQNSINYDLRRVDELLALMGNPHRQIQSVHIAGSKGKGSVAAMVASTLVNAGYRTGLYTSPHLLVFNERIRVNDPAVDGVHDGLIPDADVVDLVDRIKPVVEDVNSRATYGRLTTFEIITALGFAHFARSKCDINVIEVGLGGRLDATNVITPEVSVITSISLEHTDVLGDTLARIAVEKAGIIKPGVPVVSSPQAAEVEAVIQRTCAERGSSLVRVGSHVTWRGLDFDSARQSLRVDGRLGSYILTIPLLGEYQLENAATSVAALEILVDGGRRIPETAIAQGLATVNWPGRLQVLMRRPMVVVDGAHNPYSAARLKEAIRKHFRFDRATLVIGTSSDKDIAGMVSELGPVFDRIIVTRSIHPRALEPARLADEFVRQGFAAEVTGDITAALPLALSGCGENDLVCVTGSLYVVAGAIEQTGGHGFRTGV